MPDASGKTLRDSMKGIREPHLKSLLRQILRKEGEGVKVEAITPEYVDHFINSLDNISEKTRQIYRSHLNCFFKSVNSAYDPDAISTRGRKSKKEETEYLNRKIQELEKNLEAHRKTIDEIPEEYQETITRLTEENGYFKIEKAKWQYEKEDLIAKLSEAQKAISSFVALVEDKKSGNSIRKDL